MLWGTALCLGIFIRMGKHLIFAPVYGLPESIHQLQHRIVSYGRRRLSFIPPVNHQIHLNLFIQRVKIFQLPFFDGKDIDFPVLAGPDSKLDISFITNLELRLLCPFVPVVIGDHIILSQLGRRGQMQGLPLQGRTQKGRVCALLQGRVCLHGRHQGRNKPCARLASQKFVNLLLCCILGQIDRKIQLLRPVYQGIIYRHSHSPPYSLWFRNRLKPEPVGFQILFKARQLGRRGMHPEFHHVDRILHGLHGILPG